jgi:uncharacterized protein (TIGR03083 family)
MDAHAETLDFLGAWALDACDDDEAARVEAHLGTCPSCAAEARRLKSAAGWLGLDGLRPAPPALRESVLAAARERRAPRPPSTLVGAYAGQASLLDDLLARIGMDGWMRTTPRHDTVGGVVAHLARNDAMLAADAGLPTVTVPDLATGAVRAAWREQSQVLVRGLTGGLDLDRPVRLASPRGAPVRPLRDALVQRAFETWIHLEDIAAAVGRAQPVPPPEQVRRIVDLAVALLPEAVRAKNAGRAGHAVRLVLEGGGGGEWTFPVGRARPGRATEVTIVADAVEFARLVANRRSPATLRYAAGGDRALAERVLHIAATLGCD